MEAKPYKKQDTKTTIKVVRSFGSHNLIELYAEYVAKQIQKELRLKRIGETGQ